MSGNDELVNKILKDFEAIRSQNRKIASIREQAKAGKTTYKEVGEYAAEVGETLAKAYKANVTPETVPGKITREIAEAIIPDPMKNNFDLVSEVATQTQEAMNEAAGVHIKVIQPERNMDRIEGLIKKVSSYDTTEQALWVLDEPIVNATQSISDDYIKANAGFQHDAGLSPKIVRTDVGGCCEWCAAIAGSYDYDEVSNSGNDVFRRHERCRCTVTYELGRKRWDVWSKQRLGDAEPQKIRARQKNYEKHQLQTDRDPDKIKARKEIEPKEQSELVKALNKEGIEYNPPKRMASIPTTEEIVQKIAGGDETGGSCSSVALAYIGNKCGYDVRDFRGGESQRFFADKYRMIDLATKLDGVKGYVVEVDKPATGAWDVIQGLKKGKEYYIGVGRHASIVKVTDTGAEYLELQGKEGNGWKSFERNPKYGSPVKTLIKRFGCKKTPDKYKSFSGETKIFKKPVIVAEVDSFKNSKDFETILGYINTTPGTQNKGAGGGIR